MKTTVQLEWTDYLAALRLNARPGGLSAVVLVIAAVMLAVWSVVGLAMAVRGDFDLLRYFVPLYVVVGLILGGYFFLGPYNAKKLFQQTQELNSPMEVEVTPEGLRQTTALSQALRPWGHFSRWKENKNLLLLYIANNAFVILPKRALAEAMLAEIRAYLAATPRPEPAAWSRVRWWRILYLLIVFAAILLLLYQLRRSGAG